MTPTVSRFEEVVSRFRPARHTNAAAPSAVDPHEFWKLLAQKAIEGGYFKSAGDFVQFVEACLRHLSFEQVVQDRGYALGIRNLAEAIARRWASGNASRSAPSADEIAGLLQCEWVTSGQFRLLGSAGDRRDAKKGAY